MVSRKKLTKIQEKLNPPAWAELTKNKVLFYQYCQAHNIKVPEIYAFCLHNRWHCNGSCILSSAEEKEDFVRGELPKVFVVKRMRGAYGDGFDIIEKSNGSFVNSTNRRISARDVVRLVESGDPEGSILQQRIRNHPSISELTGVEALQTVRIITFVGRQRQVRILHAHFKTITKRGIVIDTYLEGLRGNVEAPVELETGALGSANQIVGSGEGIVDVEKHPITGRAFAGFEMPDWEWACEMVQEAALRFLPIRAIGWDVALSPEGPYIIEGNIWWDAPNQHMRMDKILKAIKEEETTKAPA